MALASRVVPGLFPGCFRDGCSRDLLSVSSDFMNVKPIMVFGRDILLATFCTACLVAVTSESLAAQDDPTYTKPVATEDGATPSGDGGGSPVVIQQDDSGTISGFGGEWAGMKHLERIQFLSNITTLRNSPTFLPSPKIRWPWTSARRIRFHWCVRRSIRGSDHRSNR